MNRASTRRTKRRDRIARWVITLGGITVIAGVAAILALIVGVTIPLFQQPRAELIAVGRLPDSLPQDKLLRLGIDCGMDGVDVTGFVWSSDGTVARIDLRDGRLLGRERPPSSDGDASRTLRGVESLSGGRYSLWWSDGGASLVEIAARRAEPGDPDAPRHVTRVLAEVPAEKSQECQQTFIRRSDSGTITRVARLADGTIDILRRVEAKTIFGDVEVNTHRTVLREDLLPSVEIITLDQNGDTLYAGTNDGRLIRWQLDEKGAVARREVVRAFSDGRAITALALVLGDVSLAVGDAAGELTTWTPVNADGTRKLRAIHRLQPHRSAVREIIPSGRTKSLVSLGQDGATHLDYMTSERHLLSFAPDRDNPVRHLALGQRGDVLLKLDSAGQLTAWRIDGGYPEISLKTLFGKVFYEGYERPEYVWQTTGGEDFEPKYSLVPLIFGTLKGTFYAMLFAAPLALFGATYLSYFTTPGFRNAIKPAVEIMATMPSVVIGFLIALWLAPIIERWILAFFISLAAVPATFAVFLVLWQFLRRFAWAKRVENGREFLAALPVLIAGVAAAAYLAAPLEELLFDGNFRRWLFEGPLGMQYDQRNCIIIAFGLGFTVIPVIFSIAEDSLSNVPFSMTAASMAVGASRWQTLWRVVLPSASPGIFAAMMIGFGRAVGETMIVLMATGNTPILDWNPLNGMRTLSANIAVEIPEAPVGGTLYRVLFLCAVLLFILTFTVNTAAELVRQRLRKRFGRL
ncbi:MAG: ABC transporter permease subunit [Pirellulaceae bacterium]|nr:ABC transporter permease subunit [Pirellulaceae bacterium]